MPLTTSVIAGTTAELRAGDEVPVIRASEVLSALSFALDLTEGQPMGHSTRCCVWGCA